MLCRPSAHNTDRSHVIACRRVLLTRAVQLGVGLLCLTHAIQRHGTKTSPGLSSAYVCEVRPQHSARELQGLRLHLFTPPTRVVSPRCATPDMLPCCDYCAVEFRNTVTCERKATCMNNLSLPLLEHCYRWLFIELTATCAAPSGGMRNALRANRIAAFIPQQAGGSPNSWKLLRVLTFDVRCSIYERLPGGLDCAIIFRPHASFRMSPYPLRPFRQQSNELSRPPYSTPSYLVATWRRCAGVTVPSLALSRPDGLDHQKKM